MAAHDFLRKLTVLSGVGDTQCWHLCSGSDDQLIRAARAVGRFRLPEDEVYEVQPEVNRVRAWSYLGLRIPSPSLYRDTHRKNMGSLMRRRLRALRRITMNGYRPAK